MIDINYLKEKLDKSVFRVDITPETFKELVDRLQAAESKLEEMAKQEPIGYLVNKNFFFDIKYAERAADYDTEYRKNSIVEPVFLHPVAQSNADKVEIDKAIDLIVELAQDLEAEIDNSYKYLQIDKYPSQKAKYDRDKDIILKAAEFIQKYENPPEKSTK